MRLFLEDEDATNRLGARLAGAARAGDVLLLSGPLGAGKSSLARAFIRARMGDARTPVPSPTFTLVQSYAPAQGPDIWHYDLWRLDGPDGLEELGWDEALAGIVLVEWPERLGAFTPAGAGRISLAPEGAGRVVELSDNVRLTDEP